MKGEKLAALLRMRAWAMTQALSAYTDSYTTTAGSCYPGGRRTGVLSDADVYNLATFGGKLYAFRVAHCEFHPVGDSREPSFRNGGPQMFRHCRLALVCSFRDRNGDSNPVLCSKDFFDLALYVVQEGEILHVHHESTVEMLAPLVESSFESLQRIRTGAITRILGKEKFSSLSSSLLSSPSVLRSELEKIGRKSAWSLDAHEKALYEIAHLVAYVGIFANDEGSIARLRALLQSYDRKVGAFRS